MKKIISTIIAASMLALPSLALADGDIKVYVKDTQIEFDAQPEIVNSRTFVPLRAIAEALGTDVQWDEKTRSVTLAKDGIQTELTIDSIITRTNTENGQYTGSIDAPPYIKDGRTMVPVRFISETFDLDVQWDEPTRSVYIRYYDIDDSKLSFYDGFTYIPDFGAYFGYELDTKINDVYYYTDVSDEDIKNYDSLVKELNFKIVDQYITNSITSYGYEYEDEQIITMDTTIEGQKLFSIKAQKKSPGISDEDIKFYEEHSTVIDFGAVYGIEPILTGFDKEHDTNTYYYDRSGEGIDIATEVNDYLNAMSRQGFTILNQQNYYTMLIKDNTLVVIDMENYPMIVIQAYKMSGGESLMLGK